MKILFFIDSLSSGGKERRLTELMKALSQNKDIEFELAVMSHDIHYEEVFNLNIPIHFIIRRTKKDISVVQKLFKLCKAVNPDIIHCWDSMTAIYSVPVCKLLNIKLVNGMVVDTPVNQTIFNKHWLRARITFPFSKVIVGNSNAGLKAYKAPKKKSLCIYNGMDLTRFEQLKEPSLLREEVFGDRSSKIFVVGMVAGFDKRKDYLTMIKVAVNLTSSKDNVRFVLVGSGVDLNEIKSKVPDSLLDKIIFLGKRSDVESIVNVFDIGILLTNAKVHGEGISNSIIEYMALGKPVIATKGGGTNEIITDFYNGFLIDAGDEIMLLERIEFLMSNRNLIKEYGDKSKHMALERFDLKQMARQYANLYNQLMN
jgi:glycosyltransferase involved in cell wall biosynthesis